MNNNTLLMPPTPELKGVSTRQPRVLPLQPRVSAGFESKGRSPSMKTWSRSDCEAAKAKVALNGKWGATQPRYTVRQEPSKNSTMYVPGRPAIVTPEAPVKMPYSTLRIAAALPADGAARHDTARQTVAAQRRTKPAMITADHSFLSVERLGENETLAWDSSVPTFFKGERPDLAHFAPLFVKVCVNGAEVEFLWARPSWRMPP